MLKTGWQRRRHHWSGSQAYVIGLRQLAQVPAAQGEEAKGCHGLSQAEQLQPFWRSLRGGKRGKHRAASSFARSIWFLTGKVVGRVTGERNFATSGRDGSLPSLRGQCIVASSQQT